MLASILVSTSLLISEGLHLQDEDLLSYREPVPIVEVITPFRSYKYQRSPELEVKSFYFPSFELTPPQMNLVKIDQHLLPLSSFLKEQKWEIPYITKTNQVIFYIPFSSSFYYSLPYSFVKTFDFNLPLSQKSNFLDFEKPLNYPVTAPDCHIDHLSILPLSSNFKITHPLSLIILKYEEPNKGYTYLKQRSSLSPFIDNYIPFYSLESLNLTPLPLQTERPPSRLDTNINYNGNEQIQLNQASKLTVQERSYKKSFKTEFSTTSCITLQEIYAPKLHLPFISSLSYPTQNSPSLTQILRGSSKVGSSPTKETDNQTSEKNNLQTSHLICKSSDFSIALNLPKINKEIKQSAFKLSRLNIDSISPSLPHIKGSISYFSHLDMLPSRPFRSPILQAPYQIAHAKPSSQSQKGVNYKTGELALNNLQLAHKFVCSHSPCLRKSSFSLDSYNPTTGSKPGLLATLNNWNPKSLQPLLITKPQFPKNSLYAHSRELVKFQTIPSSISVAVTLQEKNPLEKHLFGVINSSPTLCLVTALPSIGKSFIPYNLNDTTLDTLVTLYSKEIPPLSKTFFAYHQAIVSSFQETGSNKKNTPFSTITCTLAFPENISHQITLPKSSFSLDTLVNEALVQVEPKLAPKEGLFPEKQFLQASRLTTLVPVQSYPPFTLPYSKIAATNINNFIYISPSQPTCSLIELRALSTSFMPKVGFDELIVALQEIRALSSFCFVAEEAFSTNRSNRFILQYLAELPSLELLQTYSLSDDFKVDAHILQKPDKNGFSFSLQISPYDHECLEPIPSKVYFILDRSSSIESHRFNAFKNGLLQSLAHLHPSSSFNIITFDQSWEKLSPEDLKPSKSSTQYMKKSLEKVHQKWSSSFPTLLSVLNELQKQAEINDEPHTVIILSNGHFLKNLRYNRESFQKLFHAPTDNFSLFTAAISDNNNNFMLDLIAKLGRGEFLHSQTHAAFPRKLAVLVKRLQRPLASDLRVTLLDPSKKITLSHYIKAAPLLFSDKLYNIYGSTDKLEAINLIIQGKSGDKWINIVKKIDLTKAEKGKTLDRELAAKEALTHVMNFIFTNDQTELLAAKELLSPFDIKWAL